MIRFMLSLLIFITSAMNLNASGLSGAGFTGSASSMEFKESFLTSFFPNKENYLNAVSGIYGCPKGGQGETVILDALDPRTGQMTCYVYGEDSKDPIHIYKQNGTKDDLIEKETAALRQVLDDGTYKNLVISRRFGNYDFTIDSGYTGRYVQQFNLRDLQNKSDEVKDFIRTTSSSDSSAFNAGRISIDSHTTADKTLSNILTGMITLNPDYFEQDNLVNENGTIALKDYAVYGTGNMSAGNTTSSGNDSILKKIARITLGNNVEKIENLSVMTVVSFLDKKFWGFYAYTIYNLKDAYISILGTMMLFGGTYSLGRFGYRRIKDKINKDDEAVDKGKLASKSMDVFFVMMMFLLPISLTNTTIPDNFIYQKSNISTTQVANSEEDSNLFAQSTIASGSIRYFAELGSTWANAINDYALFSYLRYLESKQKAITANGLAQSDESIKGLYMNTFYLKKDYDFYINVCRSSFTDILSGSSRFNALSEEAKESFINNTINLEGTSTHSKLGYNKINPILCLTLEEKIAVNTKKLLSDYARIQAELEASKYIIDNYNNNTGKSFDFYLDFMQFLNNNYGWTAVAVVPPSYSLLSNGTSSVFSYDKAIKVANNDGNNMGEAWKGNDVNKNEIADNLDSGFMSQLINGAIGSMAWFVMPGFPEVFKSIHDWISTTSGFSPAQLAADGKGASNIVATAVSAIPLPVGLFGKMLSIIVKTIKLFSVPIILTAILFLSLAIAIFIYTSMIVTITMVVIGGAIVIKICIYFMELLLYFFLTDIILFISIVTNKNEYFVRFLSKGMTIALLTPSLIVLSVYVYMFFHTLSSELYTFLVNAIYSVSIIQEETISANSETDIVQRMLREMSMITMQKFGEIVISLFSLVIGVVTIFKFKDWVFKIIGIDDSDFSSSISEGFNSKVTGGVNPIK